MSPKRNQDDTDLIQLFKVGDERATNELISRYFNRVVAMAEKYLSRYRKHLTDGDDVAASVFESLWRHAAAERFEEKHLKNSNELWRLLCTMTDFKVREHLKREMAKKRGLTQTVDEAALRTDPEESLPGIERLADNGFSELEKSVLREQHQRLMNLLDSNQLQIALLRMDGVKIADIAAHFGKSQRWVDRKLDLIRKIWQRELAAE